MAAIPSRTFMLAIVFTMLMALTCWAKWLMKREVTGIPKSSINNFQIVVRSIFIKVFLVDDTLCQIVLNSYRASSENWTSFEKGSVGEILVGRTANGVTQVTTLAGVTILSDKRQSSDKAS